MTIVMPVFQNQIIIICTVFLTMGLHNFTLEKMEYMACSIYGNRICKICFAMHDTWYVCQFGLFPSIDMLFVILGHLADSSFELFPQCNSPYKRYMLLSLDILLEYWIEHVIFGLLYVMFTFPTRIFYRGVQGFATDCPYGTWCRGLTTCPLYVGPLFGNLV